MADQFRDYSAGERRGGETGQEARCCCGGCPGSDAGICRNWDGERTMTAVATCPVSPFPPPSHQRDSRGARRSAGPHPAGSPLPGEGGCSVLPSPPLLRGRTGPTLRANGRDAGTLSEQRERRRCESRTENPRQPRSIGAVYGAAPIHKGPGNRSAGQRERRR